MNDDAIASKVIECVAKSLALSTSSIQRDTKVIAELGADSLDFMDIIFSAFTIETFTVIVRGLLEDKRQAAAGT